MEVREADIGDLALVERYVKYSVGRTFEQEFADQAAGEHSLFIALDRGEITGWSFLRWAGPRNAEAFRLFPKAPEIYRLEVREALRSRGIGRALIETQASAAQARGFDAVSLGVAYDNPRAYALYRELDFRDTELTEYFDEYDYPLEGGGLGRARERCRYLVKAL